ncbi:MAG TPA: response regulator [Candidatus Dormibacteraeota bacterium]|nr:response regulator [Candidatus Dormibacteraeota bacterium]
MTQRVLVVDDEPANVELLKAYLDQLADEVLGLTESAEAERAVAEFRPDLVLLDLHMPEPDGLELLRRLRTARANEGFLPVIVLSADGRTVARNSALILGADDFLIKPLDRLEVRLRVRNQLRTRHLFQELARVTGALPHVAS